MAAGCGVRPAGEALSSGERHVNGEETRDRDDVNRGAGVQCRTVVKPVVYICSSCAPLPQSRAPGDRTVSRNNDMQMLKELFDEGP